MVKTRSGRVLSWILCMVMCISLLPVTTKAASVQSSAEAVTFGVTYSYSGKSDKYYSFTVPATGKITIQIRSMVDKQYYLRLLDINNDELWTAYSEKRDGVILSDQTDLYVSPGTYSFGVLTDMPMFTSSFTDYSKSFDISFTYTPIAVSYDKQSNDNTISGANDIVLGQNYTGIITVDDDIDYYRLTLPVAGRLHWISETFAIEHNMMIYDINGKKLIGYYNDVNSITNKSTVGCYLNLRAGTYFISISKRNGCGVYNFSTSFESSNESFLDNGSDDTIYGANPIAVNTNYNGQICKMLNDKDYYKYSVEAGKEYILNITAEFKLKWHIYDGSGKQYWCDTADYNSALDQYTYSCRIPLSAGTYYLMIETEDGPGNYTFNYSEKPVESKPAKVGLKSLKSTGKKSLTVKWKKVSGATGYQIEITKPNGKKMKKRYVGAATAKLKVTGLKSKKKYKVRVRAYKITDAGTLYGKWSTVKKVKIK